MAGLEMEQFGQVEWPVWGDRAAVPRLSWKIDDQLEEILLHQRWAEKSAERSLPHPPAKGRFELPKAVIAILL